MINERKIAKVIVGLSEEDRKKFADSYGFIMLSIFEGQSPQYIAERLGWKNWQLMENVWFGENVFKIFTKDYKKYVFKSEIRKFLRLSR